MKTINEFKSTKSFLINSVHVENMGIIHEHFGSDIVAVGHDNSDMLGVYTVRTITENELADYKIRLLGGSVDLLECVKTSLNTVKEA
ncbi:MAG TPA: hypothetical protein ENJ28_04975 [Gammaproteobacteria bacterium]|nr:hypothetical protein [Gammaproteobacteria bacterium]